MAKGQDWTEHELLVAFRLYCRTPFGKLHQRNPEIVALASQIDRTPSALAMKACNFASLDPVQQRRNIAGLGNVSGADRALWEAFLRDPDVVAANAEAAYAKLAGAESIPAIDEPETPGGPSETERLVRVRRLQGFFRQAVLTSYESRCAITGIAVPELLIASHIIPWSINSERRADPRNGITLNAFHDRAFDRGLITFDESWRLVITNKLKAGDISQFQRESLLDIEGRQLRLPIRFSPDPDAMAYHREHVFIG
jgi:putative restriction endonuclease